MPAQTPTGMVTLPMTAIAELVANSATFQDIVGATSSAHALERIHYFEASDEETERHSGVMKHPRPRAIISGLPQGWSRRRDGAGEWSGTAELMLSFEFEVPANYRGSAKEESIWFGNRLGEILSEMEVLAEQGGDYYDMQRYRAVSGPTVCDEDRERFKFWGVVFMVEGRN